MYRSLGSLSAFGVPSGPYTGPPRRLRWSDLPRAVQDRLEACLDGRGRPAPIALHVPRPTRLAKRLVGAATLGVLGLAALVVGSWSAAQPASTSALYALAVLPVVGLAVFLQARRRARGGTPFDPGLALLPLDLVVFEGATLRVAPLGDVRDVGVLAEGGSTRLALRFASGEEVTFPMPSQAHADRTYAALVHAQGTLEALSYGDDLERAMEHDPFFPIRTEGGFEDAPRAAGLAPSGPLGVGSRTSAAAYLALAALLSVAMGHVAYRATNRLSDDVRFRAACDAGTTEAMQRYLALGGRRVREAEYFFGARRMALRKDRELAEMRERVARNEGLKAATAGPEIAQNPPGFRRPRSPAEWGLAHAECLRAFTDRAPPPSKAGRALPGLVALAEEARRGSGGPARLDVRFEREIAPAVSSKPLLASLDARERETARALAVVIAEVCPPGVLEVHLARGPRAPHSPALVVRYAARGPVSRAFDGGQLTLAEVRFDVTLEVWPRRPEGFSLTLPPPAVAATRTRERSVFRVDDAAPMEGRVLAAFTARAFDRLYDELYGLFFRGDVKVPLPSFAEVEAIFMK